MEPTLGLDLPEVLVLRVRRMNEILMLSDSVMISKCVRSTTTQATPSSSRPPNPSLAHLPSLLPLSQTLYHHSHMQPRPIIHNLINFPVETSPNTLPVPHVSLY